VQDELMPASDFIAKWGSVLDGYLLDPPSNADEIESARREADELEKSYDDLHATVAAVVYDFDKFTFEPTDTAQNIIDRLNETIFTKLDNAL
jgi:hypothetical protein